MQLVIGFFRNLITSGSLSLRGGSYTPSAITAPITEICELTYAAIQNSTILSFQYVEYVSGPYVLLYVFSNVYS